MARNKANMLSYSKETYARRKVETPELIMLWRSKASAKRKDIPFDITVEDIVIPEFCPILGVRLTGIGARNRNTSPSLDRVNSDLGYHKGNVRVISNRANTIKSDLTLEQAQRLYEYMKGMCESG